MINENLAGIEGLGDDLMKNSPFSQSLLFLREQQQ